MNAHLLYQRQTGVQCMNAKHVGGTALETCAGVRRLPTFPFKIASVLHHVPAELVQIQPVANFAAAVKKRGTFRAQHPFMTIGHNEIGLYLLHVEWDGPQALNGVDTEKNPLTTTEAA